MPAINAHREYKTDLSKKALEVSILEKDIWKLNEFIGKWP